MYLWKHVAADDAEEQIEDTINRILPKEGAGFTLRVYR